MWVALLGATLLLLGPPASAAAWTWVASPNLTQFDNVLFGVDATSSSNAWAVGRADDVSSPFRRPPSSGGTAPAGASCRAPGLLSTASCATSTPAPRLQRLGSRLHQRRLSTALLQRRNGTSWTTVPGLSGSGIQLGVKTPSTSDAWVVGSRSTVGSFDSMAAR